MGSSRNSLMSQVPFFQFPPAPLHRSSRSLAGCYARKRFSKRKRYNEFYWFLANAHPSDLQVIELNPLYYLGYQLKHAALHDAQRYDEAIQAFQAFLSKLEGAPDIQIISKPRITRSCRDIYLFFSELRQHFLSLSEAEDAIRTIMQSRLQDSPHRVIDTVTGLLCDRNEQINTFKMSREYKELLSLTMMHADHRFERIEEAVVTYLRCAMLSHRWEEREPLLHDIEDKFLYGMKPVGGILKLQSFCKVARDAGCRWAWSDTCCIDKSNNIEVQESVNSMFAWYRRSALTIVYLSDVPPFSKPGALAKCAWIGRAWTILELLAPSVVIFYQKDWSPYLNDRSPNHKESSTIMQELADATGIDPQALVAFRPGVRDAREKLRWASTRVTTLQEDIAYSLFGIFDVHLPVIYGEKKQNALGKLLQEVVARSGDISALDWIGKSSEFNSCLPADISSYEVPQCRLPSLSEDEIQEAVSSLQNTSAVELASKFYTLLHDLSVPHFANCRLHLPCITFPVTEIRRLPGHDQTYRVKAQGLQDVLIATEDKLIQFSPTRPTQQTFLLVRPWNRNLLELPDFADDPQGMEYSTLPGSPLHDASVAFPPGPVPEDSEFHSRALRLMVRLAQPFSAFLLAQQRGTEYKRVASDRDVIAQVKDTCSVHEMMDSVKTLEIL